MKRLYRVTVLIFILIFSFGSSMRVSGSTRGSDHASNLDDDRQAAAPTLIPTVSPSVLTDYPTPESRVLPDVGSNAGLVIAASVLVLIIIGGVLSARLRPKH